MDVAGYTLDFDDRRAIMTSRMTGFWTLELQAEYGRELRARLNAVRASGRRFTFLCDARDYPIQSFAVSVGFLKIVRGLDDGLLVPTAIVTGRALLRIQIFRVGILPNIRVFAEEAPALAWLMEAGNDRTAVP